MKTELKIKIQRSFLDNYKRDLHLHPDFISFENKDLVGSGITSFKTDEIKEFRYGVTLYQYDIVFGRDFQIFIKNFNDEVLKINFKSYFGIKKSEYTKIYAEIINTVWDLYFKQKVILFIKAFEVGESFTIGDVDINSDGVLITISKLLKQEKKLINWKDIGIRKYTTYVSIYSRENPLDFNRGYSYKEDWNTFVLYEVIRNILENKNINND
ncbi:MULTISPECIES: hypothetical protein [unclassified Flavobacterium]|uniref:hypothetical protein n=1 Tax=unclassified Flavobacterium TaxID=196869 RepID=UPI0010669B96|nr:MULTISPECIES: hypothetical protein [unclassified Flavobacterium]MDQ1167148.1 hypothetical protein [Flavobacterium sp. SORGH_AS_0622]TDX12213.1 hypothetical protein EDB96_1266 [Flavobacterium sp. S87F.05.LMB.W.Kidney.N]